MSFASNLKHAPNNILIIRTSAIGDIIMATPIIIALKERYPEAKLSWMCEPHLACLVENHPLIDHVVCFPKSKFKFELREGRFKSALVTITSLINHLRSQHFDLAIDLQGLFKSAVWAWLSSAKRRVGFKSKEHSHLFLTESIVKEKNHPDISSEYEQMANYLGCNTDSFLMNLILPEDSMESVTFHLPWIGDTPYFVFCPFTTREQKHWFNDAWLSLAKKLSVKYKAKILILGGPADAPEAETLCRHADDVMHLCGKLSLNQSIALLKDAKAVIGVDTGLTHGAIAQKTPTIALFGSTRPYLNTRCEYAKVIYLAKQCSPCRRHPICEKSYHCMKDITVENVFDSLEKQLRKRPEVLH